MHRRPNAAWVSPQAVKASAASVGSKGGVGVRARVFLQEGVAAGSDAKVAASHGVEQVVPAQVETGEGDAVVESLVAGRSLLVAFGGGQVETVRQRATAWSRRWILPSEASSRRARRILGSEGMGMAVSAWRSAAEESPAGDTARQRPAAAVPKWGSRKAAGGATSSAHAQSHLDSRERRTLMEARPNTRPAPPTGRASSPTQLNCRRPPPWVPTARQPDQAFLRLRRQSAPVLQAPGAGAIPLCEAASDFPPSERGVERSSRRRCSV